MKEDTFQDVVPTNEGGYSSDYETQRDKPMPSYNHSILQLKIGTLLYNYYGKEFTLGSETDLDLPNASRPTVPDISIFEKRKPSLSNDTLKVKEPPLTTIEILSPKQDLENVKDKIFNNYFPAGIKSAWVVVPTTRTVTIYTPDEKFVTYATGKFTDGATGIALDIDEVFEDLEL
ncbi:MAG: Uma2 family endonuclease [Bacteroidota bacterium]